MYVDTTVCIMHNCAGDYANTLNYGCYSVITTFVCDTGVSITRCFADLWYNYIEKEEQKERIRHKRVALRYVARSLWRVI